MKDRLVILIVSAMLIVVGIVVGHYAGVGVGYEKGYVVGRVDGKYVGYEEGYKLGFANGKEYVVTHIDGYVKVPKPVTYAEVVAFLEEDKTDEIAYDEKEFDCISYSNKVRENAQSKQIKCGVAVLDLIDSKGRIGHSINAFDTVDKGIVYFSSQTDKDMGILKTDNYFYGAVTPYKIYKLDIVW